MMAAAPTINAAAHPDTTRLASPFVRAEILVLASSCSERMSTQATDASAIATLTSGHMTVPPNVVQ